MGVKTFAAITVGSYELSMKIFEFSGKDKVKCIDHVRHNIELGTDTYETGKISFERVDELCRVLREFAAICKTHRVDAYKAYGTSAIREMDNRVVVLDQIRGRTGIQIDVLSNSEQRYMDYKSLATIGDVFSSVIKRGTAVVDIGGGSIQISLFDKDTLITTQNMKLGILRMKEQLNKMNLKSAGYEEVARELVESNLNTFKKLFLRDREIDTLVVVDDYISEIVSKNMRGEESEYQMSQEMFEAFYKRFRNKTAHETAQYFDYEEEKVPLLFLSSILVRSMMQVMEVKNLYVPGVSLCDGIAYEYAEKAHLIHPKHDFEQDIIACAKNISERYRGSKKQAETIWKIASSIFDTMKKIHRMGKREKLILQIATILHDCGKYINLANDGECAYNIIMATEIIGLSHMERELVANIVRYTKSELPSFDEISQKLDLEQKDYLTIAKCSAILRVSRGLMRSHKQKYKEIRTKLEGNLLHIYLSSEADIQLEIGFIQKHLLYFEEVYSIQPVIHNKTIQK